MNISEIERKLIDLDKNLHSILEMVREAKKPEEGVVESVAGAWGYEVDSVEFVRELRSIDFSKAVRDLGMIQKSHQKRELKEL